MKKKILLLCLIGAPIGLAISTLITIAISLAVGDGNFYPVVPELVNDCGNEINAVLLQTACSLLYGAAWAGASAVWKQDGWSLLRQTATHLLVCSLATFPIAYFMRWMDHSVSGALTYFGIFFGVYLIIWLSQYSAMKKRVEEMDRKVREGMSDTDAL
jgi:ABC-type antimicrobial peptide transport system permease subunit